MKEQPQPFKKPKFSPIRIGEPHYEKNVVFSSFLRAREDEGGEWYQKDRNKEMLEGLGLKDIKPEQVESSFYYYAKNISPDEWKKIKQAQDPFLALTCAINFFREEGVNRSRYEDKWGNDFTTPSVLTMAELETLPLVYQTSPETLKAIVSGGVVLSDRKRYEQLIKEGKDPDDIEDFLHFNSKTSGDDRLAGLDNYVFTSFGKPTPTMKYGDIEILFKQDQLIDNQLSFVTKDDYLDLELKDKTKDNYRDQVLQGENFLRAAARKLSYNLSSKYGAREVKSVLDGFFSGDSDIKNQYGQISFSTWEVKTPTLTADDIDTIVFKDREACLVFRQEHKEDDFHLRIYPSRQELERVCVEIRREVEGEDVIGWAKALSSQKLSEWLIDYFSNNQDQLEAVFGIKDVVFHRSRVYQLHDAEDIYKDKIKELLEKDSQERVDAIDAMKDDEKTECFILVKGPHDSSDFNFQLSPKDDDFEMYQSVVTENTDLYKLLPSGKIFLSDDNVHEKPPSGPGVLGTPMPLPRRKLSAEEKIRWKEDIRKARIKTYILAKIVVANDELEKYMKTAREKDAHSFKTYKIIEMVKKSYIEE